MRSSPGRAVLPDVGRRRVILDLAAQRRLRPDLPRFFEEAIGGRLTVVSPVVTHPIPVPRLLPRREGPGWLFRAGPGPSPVRAGTLESVDAIPGSCPRGPTWTGRAGAAAALARGRRARHGAGARTSGDGGGPLVRHPGRAGAPLQRRD